MVDLATGRVRPTGGLAATAAARQRIGRKRLPPANKL
jgi:hypothetical protein